MKTLATTLMLSFALIGGAAQASVSSVGDPDNTPFQGVYGQNEADAPSYAQVQSQLQQAKADGVLTFGDRDNLPFHAVAEGSPNSTQVAADSQAVGGVAFGDSDNTPFQGQYAPSSDNGMQEAQAESQTYSR